MPPDDTITLTLNKADAAYMIMALLYDAADPDYSPRVRRVFAQKAYELQELIQKGKDA